MNPFYATNLTTAQTFLNLTRGFTPSGPRYSRVQVGPNATELKLLTAINSISGLVGLVGNLLVCLVVVRFRFLGRPKAEVIIASLAMADLLVCVTVQPMYVLFLHGLLPPLLNVIRKTVTWILTLVSVSHLLSISIERFLALYFLHRYSLWIPNGMIWTAITVTWLAAICLGAPTGSSLNARYVTQYFVIAVLLVIPLLYTGTFYIVRLQRKRIENLTHLKNMSPSQKRFSRERRAVFIIAVIIGVFYVCFAPLTVLPFFFTVGAPSSVLMNVKRAFPWINTLALCNSSLNPYVYYWGSWRFRLAIEMLTRRFVERKKG